MLNSYELFKNWNIWQQPQEKVFQFLVKISSSSESKISVDHLQILIKDNVPDLKMISWLLENSFQHLQNEPSCLASSKVRASVLPLIKACVNLGATANAEYMLAFAMGQGNLALFDKSLTTVIESAQRADALKRSKGLLRSVMGLVNSRREKEKTPSAGIHNKSFQDLITRLCSRAITFEFSENTLTMILSLVDRGADAYWAKFPLMVGGSFNSCRYSGIKQKY
ncbi:hypothetical protein [Endozoicomonas sp. SCSIO W0465]|uniref:hypothetical protein n=1 Tax=Endozoicomonas sp. SCSIO W0465 TaxID=2918516 RepID=UPI0020762B38|nr:hypothetical protein [Endozoicomonas sp. SCSIO W0465]USE35498.1 hypothetical protein MJO57_25955 [Endozoicomonas sp. SCSIO W0465]